MNKLITKIVGAALGLTMAVGVGVAVASSRQAVPVLAADSSTQYSLVTSTNDLVSGKSYIITSFASGSGYALSNTDNINNRPGVSASESSGLITRGSSIMSFTLGGSSGAWTFTAENYAGSNDGLTQGNQTSKNYLKIGTTSDDWTISFSGNAATITSTLQESRNVIRYNSNNGSPIFSCYTSGQSDVYLWKEASSLSSIGLSGTYPTTFTQGETFNHTGMTVTATYSDSSTKDVTSSATFSGYDMSTTGNQTVTVSYTENGITKTATYGITVNAPTKALSSIAVTATPTKTTYTEGETFDSTGMVVIATYDDNSTADVTSSCTFSPSGALSTNDTSITISYTYGGDTKTATQSITVTYAKGTENNPYTVAEAKAAIDANGGSALSDKYVTGIISQIDSYNSTYKSITYWISDDGTTTDQFEVYSGKGLNGADFSSVDDLEVGYEVTVSGTIKLYSSTYEFDKTSSIVTYIAPTFTVTYDPNGATSGTAPVDAVEHSKHTDVTTLLNTGNLAKENYNFNGWNTKADATGTHIAAGGTFEILEDTTLYAEWLSTSPSITVVSTFSGYTGETKDLEFTYGFISDENVGVVSNNANITVDDVIAIDGEAIATISFVTAGSSTLSFKNGDDVLATCTVSITQSEVTITGLPSTGSVYTTETLNLGSSITVTATGSYDDSVTWGSNNTGVATVSSSGVVTGVAAGQATITVTSNSDSNVSQSCIVTVSKAPLNVTWDLSTDTTATATTSEISWTSTYATMKDEKGNSGTNTNNYYPGTSGKSYTSTRFYSGSILTISPVDGYEIVSVIFTATSTTYASTLSNSTWTNASSSVNSTTVTVTPSDGQTDIVATIGGTCGFTQVKVNYNKTWAREFLETFTCTGAVEGHENGDISVANPTTVWGELGELFTANVSAAKKNAMKTNDTSNLTAVEINALARYDLVIRKYGTGTYADFIGRFSEGGVNASSRTLGSLFGSSDSSNGAAIIIIVSLIGITAVGGYFFLRKRKEQ